MTLRVLSQLGNIKVNDMILFHFPGRGGEVSGVHKFIFGIPVYIFYA